ncbi:hypothetical protein AKJ51_00675 [candidate division MSBL1 archaeon SCGC-AAA382A20]|uniref:Helix-turn-helix domain-containing protein n=1 Tax=candidate division MSBL1 archaeon SCGC-AAA382A20 TaxID=1698280 RepID=A0A133VMD3_9EURY|nr:hypothetical protein AKJ51_00675 [candidate division MSBL1 archaeon SCGC-AAA382A20]
MNEKQTEREVANSRESVPSEEDDYNPEEDWLNQRELARLLGIAPETASRWAKDGRLKIFEHGMVIGGKRKYSRKLVREYQEMKFRQARNRMRKTLQQGEGP